MPTEPSDSFEFRLEILKKELDFIDNSIRKIDDIGNSIKNWAILAWTGSIAAILGRPELHGYILFSAVPPLVFMLVDAYWRRIQRRFTYRQSQIANFLNSSKLDESFQTRTLDFELFDPIARKSRQSPDFRRFISLSRVLRFPTVSLLYTGLAALSIALAAILFFVPPRLPNTKDPTPIRPVASPSPRASS